MNHSLRKKQFDIMGMMIFGLIVMLVSFPYISMKALPSSFFQLNTIFISILIEAVPFVLIGVLLAGFIQIFVTEEQIRAFIPKSRVKAIVMSCVVGALFPACECGIVPIVRRLIGKGVPLYAAVGFMLTGPLINPIVIVSTYMAFGNNLKVALWRMGLGFVIALIVSFLVSLLYRGTELKIPVVVKPQERNKPPLTERIWSMLTHSIDEFFDMAKYLVLGAFLAAAVQTYVPMKTFLETGSGPVASVMMMMGLAYVLSLCSEADAFIGSSFASLLPLPSVLAFLIFGPMIDFKNTLMMLSVFKSRFVFGLLLLVAGTVFLMIMAVQNFM